MGKYSIIGVRIKNARISKGITQGKLGSEAGLDPIGASVRISRYESGAHAPEFKIAQRLAAVLNVPVAYLYCDDDNLAALIYAYHQLKSTNQTKVFNLIKELQSKK